MIPVADHFADIAEALKRLKSEEVPQQPDDGSRVDEPPQDTKTRAFEIELADHTAFGGG